MPGSPLRIVQCLYNYDPLNRSIGWAPNGEPNIQRFYRKDRLATEIQATEMYSFFEHDHHVLAQRRQTSITDDTTLLATDQQRSVLNVLDATPLNRLAYSPYGHRPHENGLLSLLGFNGERPDPVTGHYHLGHGYRQFNPVLMRFNSPDSWSPFGRGGLNAYAYCSGDSVNRVDPTGHFFKQFTDTLNNRKPFDSWFPFERRNAEIKTLVSSVHRGLGGTEKIEAQAKLSNKSSSDFFYDHLVGAVEDSIENDIYSFYKKLRSLTDDQEIIVTFNHAMESTYLKQEVVSELAMAFSKKDTSTFNSYFKRIRQSVSSFHNWEGAPYTTNARIAELSGRPGDIRHIVHSRSWQTPEAPVKREAANIRHDS